MIRKIELYNFKAHAKAVFKFGEGVNFIYGPNGSGKTSIMEAVSIALFGSQWVRRVGGRWSDYLKRGASVGEVRLFLNHMGQEVLIVRRFGEEGSSTSGTYLAIDGAVVARGDIDVTNAVVTKLGIRIDEYRHLLYIRQGELRRILQEPEYIDHILRIDEFDKVDEVVKDVLKELERRRERVGGRVEELEKRAPQLKAKADALRQRLAEAERKIKELEDAEIKFREVEKRFFELRERYISLTKEKESLERGLEETASMALEVEKDIERLEEELEFIRRAEEELSTLPELGDVEREYYEVKQLVATVEKIPPEVRSYDPKLLEETRRKYEEVSRRYVEVRSRLGLLRDVLRVAKAAERGRCPVCGAPLTEETVKRHELEALGLEKEEQRLSRLMEQLQTEIKQLETLDKTYRAYAQYLSIDLQALKKRLAELETLYQRKREVEKKRAYLSGVVARRGEVERRLEELKARKAALEKRIEEINGRLNAVETELKTLATVLTNIEAEYTALKVKHEEFLAAKMFVSELKRQLEDIERELIEVEKELEKNRYEVQKLDKALGIARNIRVVIGELKPLARQILTKAINEELNSIFLKLRHKEVFRSVQLVEIDGKYSIRVNTPAGYIDHRLLSLGEQNLLAISLRVALARALLGGAPFMMFDEPTEHLDEEHRRKIVELIRDLTSIVPTVVVTSHLGEFEEVADVVIQL